MDLITHTDGNLEYLTAPALSCGGAVHAFSTRYGGVSSGHLSALNLGTHRGDAPENVMKNYRILGNAVGFSPENTVFTKQEHTCIVRRVGAADRGTGLLREQANICDGLITNEPEVALCCFGADCATVLLYDPVCRAVGAVHSGWRGTAQGIVYAAIKAMEREFGASAENIRAAIGPSIGQCCFETDADVPQAMLNALGSEAGAYIERRGDKFYVDNKGLCRLWLTRAGVTQIDVSRACTKCQNQRFWSHRAVGNARGSQVGIIMLQT